MEPAPVRGHQSSAFYPNDHSQSLFDSSFLKAFVKDDRRRSSSAEKAQDKSSRSDSSQEAPDRLFRESACFQPCDLLLDEKVRWKTQLKSIKEESHKPEDSPSGLYDDRPYQTKHQKLSRVPHPFRQSQSTLDTAPHTHSRIRSLVDSSLAPPVQDNHASSNARRKTNHKQKPITTPSRFTHAPFIPAYGSQPRFKPRFHAHSHTNSLSASFQDPTFSSPPSQDRLSHRPQQQALQPESTLSSERLHGSSKRKHQRVERSVDYQVDPDKPDPTKTAIMIRNIPNKYSQKMMLDLIDEQFKGTYDFFYLPMDLKNNCNIGYAFINFLSPDTVPAFFRRFHGMRWTQCSVSSKVCSIRYARIQGLLAHQAHFSESRVMTHHDKQIKPLVLAIDFARIETLAKKVSAKPRLSQTEARSSSKALPPSDLDQNKTQPN